MSADPSSLDRLHDVVAPPAVPWWPPAPGWDWVLAALAAALLVAVVRVFICWQHNRYRREALAEWKLQAARLGDPAQRAPALTAMSVFLKRVALTKFPRRDVASLHGAAWLAFLDHTARTMNAFSTPAGALLEYAVYDPRRASAASDAEIAEAADLTREWITHHRAEERK